MHEMFKQAKRCIASIGPGQPLSYSIYSFQRWIPNHCFVTTAKDTTFLTGSVIGKEENLGIVQLPALFQVGDEFAHVLIDVVNASGVGRLYRIQSVMLFGG